MDSEEHEQPATPDKMKRRVTPAHEEPMSAPAGQSASCPTCAGMASPMTPVYAFGQVSWLYPGISVEKEFAQATARSETAGQTDQQAFYTVLSQPENRYLARQLCWVLKIQGLETYILQPRDPRDYERLAEAARPEPSPLDMDVVIGLRGPLAPPELCNGLMIPIVMFDQIYSFDRNALIKAIPRPENVAESEFETSAAELLDRILQITDNAGATDEHRAMNYAAIRSRAVFERAAQQFARDFSLSRVYTLPSPLSGARNIIDVIFAYANRNTDFIEKYALSVDVTDEFPFMVKKLSPYFDRYAQ